MITNKLGLFIGGFIIGLIISFFVANSQYQNKTTAVPASGTETADNETAGTAGNEELPPGHPPVESEAAKAAISSSKTGPLEAFGAPKGTDKSKGETTASNAATDGMEKVYKNIQVLKGVPAGQLQTIMQSFTEGLGVKCNYCHVSLEEAFKDDKSTKQIARKMLVMTRDINKGYPTSGMVTCFTCHRGSAQPAS
jgi:hypothetical protein